MDLLPRECIVLDFEETEHKQNPNRIPSAQHLTRQVICSGRAKGAKERALGVVHVSILHAIRIVTRHKRRRKQQLLQSSKPARRQDIDRKQ